MSYNHRQILQRLDAVLSSTPRCPLETLAQTLGVCRRTVERTVQEFWGIRFHEYRDKRLLGRCISIMGQEMLSEKEIAFRAGFRCTSSFCRFIKQRTGQTLTSLRSEICLILSPDEATRGLAKRVIAHAMPGNGVALHRERSSPAKVV